TTLLQWVGADPAAGRAGAPLTNDQIDRLLDRCVTEVEEVLRANVAGWTGLPEDAQLVLADMTFQMGWPRVRDFRKALAAVERGDFETAADEMLDSTWAKEQTPRRAEALAELMRGCAREEKA
ncbi:MAG: hypothetical protein ABFD65_15600, partial [Candidatus Polarisedimenticolia bacterium]